jgi:hypothetical protein
MAEIWDLRRTGGAAVSAAALMVGILVATTGVLMYEGNATQQSQSQGGGPSTSNIGGMLSDGLSMVKDGLKFASGGGLAEVQTAGVGLIADTFTGDSPLPPTCSSTPRNSYIELTNTGSANGTATGVKIVYGGETNSFAISGPCTIGPSKSSTASMYILFGGPSKLPNSLAPVPGIPYSGTVTLSDGANLPFTGSFYQGYPQISIPSVAIAASAFTEGYPGNTTCSTTLPDATPYLMVVNTGTVGASFTSVAVTWKVGASTFPIVGSCFVGPDGTPAAVIYVIPGSSNKLSVAAEPGESFTGDLTPSFGAPVSFSGIFQ